MTIPISKTGRKDKMYWIGNEKGIYSVKSGSMWAKLPKQRRKKDDGGESNQSKNMEDLEHGRNYGD